jgi:hypothetical protein
MAYVFNPFTGKLDTTDVVAFNGEVNAGTESSPSLFFTGDSNTGIYSPGADQLAISTGGNERLRIDSSGNVGIGVSSPADKMEIVAATNAGLQIGAASGTGSIGVQIAGVMDAIPTARVRGYIGTTNSSAGVAGDLLIAPRTSSAASIRFITRGSGSPSEAVRIDNLGRLLVGTDADSGGALLQVNGDRIRVATAKTPASATDTGTAGEICWDADYIYVCVATDSWKRTAIAAW